MMGPTFWGISLLPAPPCGQYWGLTSSSSLPSCMHNQVAGVCRHSRALTKLNRTKAAGCLPVPCKLYLSYSVCLQGNPNPHAKSFQDILQSCLAVLTFTSAAWFRTMCSKQPSPTPTRMSAASSGSCAGAHSPPSQQLNPSPGRLAFFIVYTQGPPARST